MRFSFITLFPELISFYFQDSILKRAVDASLITYDFTTPRDFSGNKYNKVDEYLAGGGAGLLIRPEPVMRAIDSVADSGTHVVFLLPAGKPFRQSDAVRLSSKKHLCLVCSRYEGVDERVVESRGHEVFSIGDFILTGGELPALVMCDAVSRHVPGVLGNEDSLSGESFESALLEPPPFTKPNELDGNVVPSEFLKGNHSKIASLKSRLAQAKTAYYRPDLWKKHRTDMSQGGKKDRKNEKSLY